MHPINNNFEVAFTGTVERVCPCNITIKEYAPVILLLFVQRVCPCNIIIIILYSVLLFVDEADAFLRKRSKVSREVSYPDSHTKSSMRYLV